MMYKIKNVTDEKIMFVDTKGKKIHIKPGEEVENRFPSKYGYQNKLKIEEINKKKKKKKKDK